MPKLPGTAVRRLIKSPSSPLTSQKAPAPAKPTHAYPWLSNLKTAPLRQLAIALGAPSSGTKAVVIQGLCDALTNVTTTTTSAAAATTTTTRLPPHNRQFGTHNEQFSNVPQKEGNTYASIRKKTATDELSIVSIDMGIKNLAFSHWTVGAKPVNEKEEHDLEARVDRQTITSGPCATAVPVLRAWRKIDVSCLSITTMTTNILSDSDDNAVIDDESATSPESILPPSFEPHISARHAYNFVSSILQHYNPTHVLIERQRFRTGGSAAVTEWTIRVGVFEGMLYACLRCLAQNHGHDETNQVQVEGVLPRRVNRFWLEGGVSLMGEQNGLGLDVGNAAARKEKKQTAKKVKQEKIELVKRLLETSSRGDAVGTFQVHKDVIDMVDAFLSTKKKKTVRKINRESGVVSENKSVELSKLDDLADCFLQGLAWIKWRENRIRVGKVGEDSIHHLI